MTTKTPKYIGIDIETTGLDEQNCWLLEVAVVLFDEALNVVEGLASLTTEDTEFHHIENDTDEYVQNMHKGTGLWDEIRLHYDTDLYDDYTVEVVEAQMLAMLDRNEVHSLPLLGSSCGFDRAVISRTMPTLAKRLHYRTVDASTLLELVDRSTGANARQCVERARASAPGWVEAIPHRAMYDILVSANSIREATVTLTENPPFYLVNEVEVARGA